MARKHGSKNKTRKLVKAAFDEIEANPPSTLKKQAPEKMRKQKIAIALSKARQAGAKIPKKGRKK